MRSLTEPKTAGWLQRVVALIHRTQSTLASLAVLPRLGGLMPLQLLQRRMRK
jgi:hypothetical protein